MKSSRNCSEQLKTYELHFTRASSASTLISWTNWICHIIQAVYRNPSAYFIFPIFLMGFFISDWLIASKNEIYFDTFVNCWKVFFLAQAQNQKNTGKNHWPIWLIRIYLVTGKKEKRRNHKKYKNEKHFVKNDKFEQLTTLLLFFWSKNSKNNYFSGFFLREKFSEI